VPDRPRHPNGDFELVLRSAEQQGWRVEGGHRGKYYKLKCPCPEKHMKTMHLTPSDPNYLKNWLHRVRLRTCWEAR
jgi:hypothetical protein